MSNTLTLTEEERKRIYTDEENKAKGNGHKLAGILLDSELERGGTEHGDPAHEEAFNKFWREWCEPGDLTYEVNEKSRYDIVQDEVVCDADIQKKLKALCDQEFEDKAEEDEYADHDGAGDEEEEEEDEEDEDDGEEDV